MNVYTVTVKQGTHIKRDMGNSWVETHVVTMPDVGAARNDVLAKIRKMGYHVHGASVVRLLATEAAQADGYPTRAPDSDLVSNLAWRQAAWDEAEGYPAAPGACEGAVDCDWQGVVAIFVKDSPASSWGACREHAAPFRKMLDRFTVIDSGLPNRHVKSPQ